MNVEDSYKSKLMKIDSRDRLNKNDLTTKFEVNVGETSSYYDVKKIVLKSFQFWNMAYNIKLNDLVVFDLQGFGITGIDFVGGRYTWSDLKADIESQVSMIIGEAFTMTENANTKLITCSTVSVPFKILPSESTLWEKFGFMADTGYALTHTATQSMNLSDDMYYLGSKTLATGNMIDSDDGGVHSIIADIPITGGFGEKCIWSDNSESNLTSITYQTVKKISIVDLFLLDEQDKLVDLRGSHIIAVFKLYY